MIQIMTKALQKKKLNSCQYFYTFIDQLFQILYQSINGSFIIFFRRSWRHLHSFFLKVTLLNCWKNIQLIFIINSYALMLKE